MEGDFFNCYMMTLCKGIESKLTMNFANAKHLAKWKIATKTSHVLPNDYKHTGYGDNYILDLAISFIIHRFVEHATDNATNGKEKCVLFSFPNKFSKTFA
jgi:hypothetical protein